MALGVSAPSVLEPHIKKYKEDVQKANPVGQFINDQWLSATMGYCDEDNKAARELCTESLKTFFGPDKPYLQGQKDLYQRLVDQWGGVPDHLSQNFSRYVDVEASQPSAEQTNGVDLSGGTTLARRAWEEMDADTLAERGVIVAGDPESCIKAIKLHEATGVDQLQFLMATETVEHKKVMKSIEMFGKYVIPEFKKAEAKA
jgi:alkanesulfonate monooxygenase SsuD/methylene tetrahydromethanopterin reductase-like flavin-dependent oxidoreductase (luciferase family)